MIIEPGAEVRAFRLDGTAVTGIVVSAPVRMLSGGTLGNTVVLEDGSSHQAQLVEPFGATLDTWYERRTGYIPKVTWESLAYAILDDMLAPAHWSSHMNEYVKVSWEKREIHSELGSFHGYADSGERPVIDSDTFLERLAPALWAFQDEERSRIDAAVSNALELLGEHMAVAMSLPPWATDFVKRSSGLRLVSAPYPMVMTGPKEGRFVPIVGIVPKPKGM